MLDLNAVYMFIELNGCFGSSFFFFLLLVPSCGKAQDHTASFMYMKHILTASTDEMFSFDTFPTNEGCRCETVTVVESKQG